ncbi:MAG: response regulator [Chloroflexi bacterium]|nr:response regulator [Chloroflexota bacterium]
MGQSAVDAVPAPQDAGRRLRHDVRTLIGQISGYSELLLEESQANAWAGVDRDLLAIQATCNQLLLLCDGLGTSSSPSKDELRQSIVVLLEHAENLSVRLTRLADDVSLEDVMTIRQAGYQLLGVVDDPTAAPIDAVRPPETVDPADARRASRERAADPTDRSSRVLVVDDDPRNRDLLGRRLARLHCTVATAVDGKQALEMLRAGPFDLVLLDIVMPRMDGYETLRRVKAEPALRHIPVVVLSAVDGLDSVVRCVELGAEDYLAKPIHPALLRARVEACLDKKRLRDQEAAYLREVSRVTAAAADIEVASFDPESLGDLAARSDALGRLVRVVQGVAAAYTHQTFLAEENARLLGILRQQVDELERSRRLITTGEERLRRQIAELLHSRVQNRLLLAWYRLEECRVLLADQPAAALVDEVSRQLHQVREHDVREVSHLLHPSIIEVALVPAVERLTEDFLSQFQVELVADPSVVRLDDPEDNRLPEAVRLAAYRVVEEALGNAARHAGASRVEVSLGMRHERLAITVRDDGQGFEPAGVRAGLGLSSIAARVGSVGGAWRVTSAPGQGTVLEAFLPLEVPECGWPLSSVGSTRNGSPAGRAGPP